MEFEPTASPNPMPPAHRPDRTALSGAMEYHGNVNYCYADAAAMFLGGHGVRVSAGLLEVLTGISLQGAHRLSEPQCEKLYFSLVPGPERLTAAFDLIGVDCTPRSGPANADPVALLAEELRAGPVLLGPLDMGYLRYFPHHHHASGADHYVVAYDMDDEWVYVHDPLGFPASALMLSDLVEAWRGDDLPCPGPPYHRWAAPRQYVEPTPEQRYTRAAAYFRQVQRQVPAGGDVIREFAEALRTDALPPRSHAFLTIFSFPVQARRGLDYAAFFRAGGDTQLAEYKSRQAVVFSECLQAANVGDWSAVADRFHELAELDEKVAAHPVLG